MLAVLFTPFLLYLMYCIRQNIISFIEENIFVDIPKLKLRSSDVQVMVILKLSQCFVAYQILRPIRLILLDIGRDTVHFGAFCISTLLYCIALE